MALAGGTGMITRHPLEPAGSPAVPVAQDSASAISGKKYGHTLSIEIMHDTTPLLQAFWDCSNQRNWDGLATLLHPEFVYTLPQTRERVCGAANLVEFFRTWPGDWFCQVQTLLADGAQGASTIRFVPHPGAADGDCETGISFFTLRDGRINSIVEYWPQSYQAPPRHCTVVEHW